MLLCKTYSHSDCVSNFGPKTMSSNVFHLYVSYMWKIANIAPILCRCSYQEMESISPPLNLDWAYELIGQDNAAEALSGKFPS